MKRAQNQGTDGGHGKPHTGHHSRAGEVGEQRRQAHANQRSQRQNPYANAAVLVAHGFRAASKEAQLGRLTVEVLFQSGQLAVKLVPQTDSLTSLRWPKTLTNSFSSKEETGRS